MRIAMRVLFVHPLLHQMLRNTSNPSGTEDQAMRVSTGGGNNE
jgi:hypothetical protein